MPTYKVYDFTGQSSTPSVLTGIRSTYNNVPIASGMATFYIEGPIGDTFGTPVGDTSTGPLAPTRRDATAAANLRTVRNLGYSVPWYLCLANARQRANLSIPPTLSEQKFCIDSVKYYYPEVDTIFFDNYYADGSAGYSEDHVNSVVAYAVSQGFAVELNGVPSTALNQSNVSGFLCERSIEYITDPESEYYEQWYIPQPSDIDASFQLFGSDVIASKRILLLYLGATWMESHIGDEWLTSGNISPYLANSNSVWFTVETTGEYVSTLTSVLSGINTAGAIPTVILDPYVEPEPKYFVVDGLVHWIDNGIEYWIDNGIDHWIDNGIEYWFIGSILHWLIGEIEHQTVNPDSGTFITPQTITLDWYAPANIYYTIDGTDPDPFFAIDGERVTIDGDSATITGGIE